MRKAFTTLVVAYAFAWPSRARNRSLSEGAMSGGLKLRPVVQGPLKAAHVEVKQHVVSLY